MRKTLVRILILAALLASLGLRCLNNTGILSQDNLHIQRYSAGLLTPAEVTAIVDVNLVPMDSERILPSQTVFVQGCVIEEIGSTGPVQVPQDALIVDGQGEYLMPGLVDMHVHILFENDMLLWAANGVTSVRNMWGHTGKMSRVGFPDQFALRTQIG